MHQDIPLPPVLQYHAQRNARPTSVKVVAVLAIIFGSVSLIRDLFAIGCVILAWIQPWRFAGGTGYSRIWFAMQSGAALVYLALATLELFSGINALRLKRWSRSGLICYAILEISLDLLFIIYGAIVICRRRFLLGRPIQAEEVFILSFYAVTLAWPILVFYTMTRPGMKAAFASEGHST